MTAPRAQVIIVGGGLAGLSAGCHAQASGYDTMILEQASTPGGVCTAWRRGGYTFDGCIHWLIGYREGTGLDALYEGLGIKGRIVFKPVSSYMNALDETTGACFEIGGGYEGLRRSLLEISPGDGAEIERFMSMARYFSRLDMPVDPPESMGMLAALRMLWQWRRAIFSPGDMGLEAGEYAGRFSDPWLRKIMAGMFHPGMPAMFNAMIVGWLLAGELFTIEGGSLGFARAVEDRYRELGGRIEYDCAVKRIMVRDGRACGVETEDGRIYEASSVISAADMHATLNGMLGARYIPERLRAMFAAPRLFDPIVLISYGLRAEPTTYPQTNLLYLDTPLTAGGRASDAIMVRDSAFDPSLSPSGRKWVQATVPTDYDYWSALRSDRIEAYNDEKRRLAEMVLGRLEYMYPGIAGRVEVMDVATPATFYRYTRNWRGAYEGWLMTMETFRSPIKKTLPGLAGFYMAGQWVEPGGGVPTVLVSGRNAVREMCKADGARFTPPGG